MFSHFRFNEALPLGTTLMELSPQHVDNIKVKFRKSRTALFFDKDANTVIEHLSALRARYEKEQYNNAYFCQFETDINDACLFTLHFITSSEKKRKMNQVIKECHDLLLPRKQILAKMIQDIQTQSIQKATPINTQYLTIGKPFGTDGAEDWLQTEIVDLNKSVDVFSWSRSLFSPLREITMRQYIEEMSNDHANPMKQEKARKIKLALVNNDYTALEHALSDHRHGYNFMHFYETTGMSIYNEARVSL